MVQEDGQLSASLHVSTADDQILQPLAFFPTDVQAVPTTEMKGTSQPSLESIAESSDGKLVYAVDDDGEKIAVGLFFEQPFTVDGQNETLKSKEEFFGNNNQSAQIPLEVASYQECESVIDNYTVVNQNEKNSVKDEPFVPDVTTNKKSSSEYIKVYKRRKPKLTQNMKTLSNLRKKLSDLRSKQHNRDKKEPKKRTAKNNGNSVKVKKEKANGKKGKGKVKKINKKCSVHKVSRNHQKKKKRRKIQRNLDKAYPIPASIRRKYFPGGKIKFIFS